MKQIDQQFFSLLRTGLWGTEPEVSLFAGEGKTVGVGFYNTEKRKHGHKKRNDFLKKGAHGDRLLLFAVFILPQRKKKSNPDAIYTR